MKLSPAYIPTCPVDDWPLEQRHDGIRCPQCGREWVVSVSAARPYGPINPDAPFASLVVEIDRITHERIRSHRKDAAA